jgi:hypothetical protein
MPAIPMESKIALKIKYCDNNMLFCYLFLVPVSVYEIPATSFALQSLAGMTQAH